MSDGHYNRALLPRNNYQSALNMGKAMERQTCEKALQEALDKHIADNPELRDNILKTYHEKLSHKK